MHATKVVQGCGGSETIGILSFSVEELKGREFSLILLLLSSAESLALLLH